MLPTENINFNDNFIKAYIMVHKNIYIIINKSNNKIIKNFIPSRETLGKDYKTAYRLALEHLKNKKIHKVKRALFFHEKKNTGIAHAVSILSNYLMIAENVKAITIIPETISKNILDLVNRPFHKKVKILRKDVLYDCDRFFMSKYLDLVHPFCGTGSRIVTPTYQSHRYPLIYEQKCMEWLRVNINKYIDYTHRPKNMIKYMKIFVGKFEGQGKDTVNAQPPRTDYGFIGRKLLSRFEKNGFVNIDPYKYDILDVIWYIRNCKELIISTGTAAHLYSPYVSKKTKVYYMINVIGENHVFPHNNDKNTHLTINNDEYMLHSMGIHWYNDYRICFYKTDPKWRGHNGRSDWELYKGEDMLDFLEDDPVSELTYC
jgi:hypothetical protein